MTQPTHTEAQLSVAIWLVGMCAQSDGRRRRRVTCLPYDCLVHRLTTATTGGLKVFSPTSEPRTASSRILTVNPDTSSARSRRPPGRAAAHTA